MFIKENMFDYEIIIDHQDLIDYGRSMEAIMADLIEASHLIKKPLSDNYEYTYEPIDMCWHIKIKKELDLYERY